MVNLELNRHLVDKIMMSISSVGESDFYLSATELDSHANMVVIGKQVFVFSHSGQYANVQAFVKEVKGLPKVPIVDAVIAYDSKLQGRHTSWLSGILFVFQTWILTLFLPSS